MKANWERIIKAAMEPVELIPGQGSSIYSVRGDKTSVWVLTDVGDFPAPPPPLDKFEVAPAGGKEVTFDLADPNFLVVRKSVGMAEYTHHIPWDKIVDMLFRAVN